MNDHSEHSISNKKMGMQMQSTIPDVTWVTSDVRAWLCEHDVKFDKDIGHVALVALAQASASAPAMPTRVPAMPGAGDVSKEAAAFDFSTLCPLETAMWTTDFNWGCERAGAAQRAADAGVLRAAEYEKEDRRPREEAEAAEDSRRASSARAADAAAQRAAAYERADSLLPVSHEAIAKAEALWAEAQTETARADRLRARLAGTRL